MAVPTSRVTAFMATMIVVTIVTWMVGLLDIQYKSEQTLAFETGFPGELAAWKPAGDPRNIIISEKSVRIDRITDERSYAMRTFALPPAEQLRDRHLRVRGNINTLVKASPLESERVAAYMIWFLDDKQETIQYLTVQALTGDFAHYRAERIVSIPDAARYFVTTLINRDSDGAFELTDARVTVVSTSLLYRVISPLIFALWVGLLLAAMLWLLKNGGPQVGFPASVLLLLILTGVLLPESITTNHVLPAYQKVAALLSLQHAEPLGILYKVGHFLFFLALSFTLMLNRYRLRLSAPMVLTFMLVFALATEGLQLHLFNRSTRFLDIAIDLAGVLLAWLIVSKLQSLLVRKKRIRTSTIATKSRRYR